MANATKRDGVLHDVITFVKPVDLKALEDQGILVKKGAWYTVRSIDGLPEKARKRVRDVKVGDDGECMVRFSRSFAERFYRRMVGRNDGD